MLSNFSKNSEKYQWTSHSLLKMKYYGLSQQRVKRVIKSPDRVEEGIVEKTIACMQNSGSSKHPYEIWAMYQISKSKVQKSKSLKVTLLKTKGIKIISAWRYPGKSPKNNPVPEEILREIKNII